MSSPSTRGCSPTSRPRPGRSACGAASRPPKRCIDLCENGARSTTGTSGDARRRQGQSLRDRSRQESGQLRAFDPARLYRARGLRPSGARRGHPRRSEEHTSELQSRENLVCRLLLEKKKKNEEVSARLIRKKITIKRIQ